MQQADDVSLYAREDCPRIHGVRSLIIYSSYWRVEASPPSRSNGRIFLIGERMEREM